MGQLVRRLWSAETGSALVEYGLIIAVLALSLIAVLTGFRSAVGDLTNRTSVTIARQSSQGYGAGGGVVAPPVSATPVPEEPAAPDSSGADSTGIAAALHAAGAR
jgi:Flp pilus assembly pilin Flp